MSSAIAGNSSVSLEKLYFVTTKSSIKIFKGNKNVKKYFLRFDPRNILIHTEVSTYSPNIGIIVMPQDILF